MPEQKREAILHNDTTIYDQCKEQFLTQENKVFRKTQLVTKGPSSTCPHLEQIFCS
uniref:Uncharacterized protein n=1 Tax=Rhizophora mucronata TaxID=61149 RepID=A0A2P2LD11_RHIMU